jgi:hypothetical protein
VRQNERGEQASRLAEADLPVSRKGRFGARISSGFIASIPAPSTAISLEEGSPLDGSLSVCTLLDDADRTNR